MPSTEQTNKSERFQLFKPKQKKPKKQSSEKSSTKQTHAQDTENAEYRETEAGSSWLAALAAIVSQTRVQASLRHPNLFEFLF
ncbi:hypothetical protein LA080_006322 [Diaporthe eres]|nr:hypothetical protein LA080_006322 [Diaporthe eres]